MAKPFAFKLDKVLEYRRQLEDQARQALATAQARHDAQKKRVESLEIQLAEHVAKGYGRKKTSAGDIWLWRNYKEALEQDLVGEKAALGTLALKLQQCRRDAIARSRDRKLLEKLREQQAKKHHEEQSLDEQKEYDELATICYQCEDI